MPIIKGSGNNPIRINLGGTKELNRVYLGSNIVWNKCSLDLILQSKSTEEPTVENADYSTVSSGRSEYINSGLLYHANYESYIGSNYDVRSNRTAVYDFYTYTDLEPIFKNFMNSVPYYSVWIDSNNDGIKDPLSKGSEVTIGTSFSFSSSKDVIIGIIGDNKFHINYDGNKIVSVENIDAYNFKYLHLFPLHIETGQHYITFTGIGDGSVNDSLGVIIWDNSLEDLVLPIPKNEWNVLYSSYDSITEPIDIVTCPFGYSYDNDSNQCIKILDLSSLTTDYYLLVTPLLNGNVTITTVSWNMNYGDGIIESGSDSSIPINFEHQYALAGQYNITLELIINGSSTYTASNVVTVS